MLLKSSILDSQSFFINNQNKATLLWGDGELRIKNMFLLLILLKYRFIVGLKVSELFGVSIRGEETKTYNYKLQEWDYRNLVIRFVK